ncbi:Ras-GEF domain-containing protein NDAI_0H00410 [Naumovozyma dairenensis CBS 421]|uniref:Ras-GEF domain-containing protein n=1 Tax=Naumovozyma dairenensis (strain ATCC 10597 / BCRC 20456 / CBS 421 / NBRC 0211 / NRRL Y-12639) TaxID=1071378 RepID=G0WEK4_NAUDC|nr:hypothetical protein NDAI_0H00410 [Naumovozyma dairenensis CBS 421]CCD26215.1 hypothetical protein NDAI_0H00410 [Naumovozyma dairenensis CBS 421]
MVESNLNSRNSRNSKNSKNNNNKVKNMFSNNTSNLILNFPNDDHLIDLTPRDLSNVKTTYSTKSSNNNNSSSNKNKNRNTNANAGENVSSTATSSKNNSITSQFNRTNMTESIHSLPSSQDQQQQQQSNPLSQTIPPSSSQPQQQPQQQHFPHQAILSKDALFYKYPMDIKLWTELQNLTIHYTKLSHEMFVKNNRSEFTKCFNYLSNLIVFTQLSCRLIQQLIKSKQYNKDIKKYLKNLISSLSKIIINSRIYFDTSFMLKYELKTSSNSNTNNDNNNNNNNNNKKTMVEEDIPDEMIMPNRTITIDTDASIANVNDDIEGSSPKTKRFVSTSSSTTNTSSIINNNNNNNNYTKRTISTSTNDTIVPNNNNNNTTMRTRNSTLDNFENPFIYDNNKRLPSTLSTPRTSLANSLNISNNNNTVGINDTPSSTNIINQNFNTNGSTHDEENRRKIRHKSIFEIIDQEFLKFYKNIQMLHHVLQTSVLTTADALLLPQILPRFFKGSFSGGSWTNPFSGFIYSDSKDTITTITSNPSNPSIVTSRNSSYIDGSSTNNSINIYGGSGYGGFVSGLPPKMAEAIAQAAGQNPISSSTSSNKLDDLSTNGTSQQGAPSTTTMTMTTLNSSSTFFNRPSHDRTFSRSRISKRKTLYPLNYNTLNLMKKISKEIYDKFDGDIGSDISIWDGPMTKAKNLEINSKTYEQINRNISFVEILENLDLTIFINLKKLIKSPPKILDFESEEFLKHAMLSISTIITEFFDIKQAFHDIVVKLIMTTQQTTLEDPYVFASMKSNFKIGYYEPMNYGLSSSSLDETTSNTKLVMSTKLMRKTEKFASALYKNLIDQDVETNRQEFLNVIDDFRNVCEKYVEISNISCFIVEQLIEERENLLNYAARMMKNNLTTELLRGEQERWFDYPTEYNSDDEFIDDDDDDDDDDNDDEIDDDGANENDGEIHSNAVTDDDHDENDKSAIKINDEEATVDGSLLTKEESDTTESDVDKDAQSDNELWFLQSEYQSYLIYDSKGKIRGGTKESLIEHLTSHQLIDPAFSVVMLITFRSIMTTKEFFFALIYRYNLSPPEGLSFDDYNIWIEKKLMPIKCRVITIMNTFLQRYWTPNYLESGLSALSNFANFAISENIPGSEELLQRIEDNIINIPTKHNIVNESSNSDNVITKDSHKPLSGTLKDKIHSVEDALSIIDDTTTVHTSNNNNKSSISSNPDYHSSSNSSLNALKNLTSPVLLHPTNAATNVFSRLKKPKLLETDAYTYAEQLTVREHELYLEINMFECLDRAWGSKYCNMGGSPNISKFISNANALTNFVSYTIVRHTDVKKRAKLIEYFIVVAQYCKELNNFSSMTAIVSALYSSPIFRLKKTWKLIPIEAKKVLRKLNNLMDSKKNFIKYRESIRGIKDVPCIPFFGIYLSDLTFTFVGNPEYLHGSTDIINFSKRSRIVDIIEEILSFKKFHYKLKRNEDIENMIQESLNNGPHIEKQYQLSLKAEPRIENTNGGGTNLSNDILSDETDDDDSDPNDHHHHHHHLHQLQHNIGPNKTNRHHSHSHQGTNHHNSSNGNDFDDKDGQVIKYGKKKQSAKLFG